MQTAKEALNSLQIKTINTQVIITQLQTIHSKINDRSTKIRITKMIDKIQKEYVKDGMPHNAVES
jgi:hypothetical protein